MISAGTDTRWKNRVIALYLAMLAGHVAHVFEELWGGFWLLTRFGLGRYLAVNWVLLCIPGVLFFFVVNDRRWAYKLSIAYAGFMGLQGIGHNVGTIVTGRYSGGFAGGYSGIGLLVVSLPMMYFLWRGMPRVSGPKGTAQFCEADEALHDKRVSAR